MTLTYSPKTGYVKRDGALVGRVEAAPRGWSYSPFVWDRKSRMLSRDTLPALLAAVRASLDPTTAIGTFPDDVSRKGSENT